jgi:formylglycine-generating enzyme required for sulfatase activity
MLDNARLQRERAHLPGEPREMVRIPGGTFHMGSDKHYPEEAPSHRVTVGGFWIDCTPVTNRAFRRFVNATGYVTFAEIPPDPKDYPSPFRPNNVGPVPEIWKRFGQCPLRRRSCAGFSG